MNATFLTDSLRGYARDAASAFRQTPVEVLLGVTTAVVFSIAIRQASDAWAQYFVGAALALPLVFGLSVLRARGVIAGGTRWGASAGVLLAAAAYGRWVYDPRLDAEGWRLLAVAGAVAMAFSLVPTVAVADREGRRMQFWRFNSRLITRIATVVAYGGALFASLAGAVAAVIELFDLDTPRYLFGDLGSAIFFGLVPWVVAGGLPEIIAAPAREDGPPPRAVRLLGSYLYAPILAVYLCILLAYAAKVLVTGEAPKNLLSPIILLAGGVGFLGSTLLEPLRPAPEHQGVARLIRFLPVPLLVLLPFALWAVWVRRDQYGWTEFRYLRFALLLALAVLAVSGAVRLLRRREPVLLLVPIVLGGTLLLSSFGPWSATAVSRRSQQARLREALAEAGVLQDGRVTMALAPPLVVAPPARPVDAETYERISGSLTYLYDQHGAESVRELFAADVGEYENGRGLLTAFRFRPGCPADRPVRFVSATLPDSLAVTGFPGGTLYRLRANRRRMDADTTATRLRYTNDAAVVRIGDGAAAWTARADLRPLFARMTRGGGEGCAVEGESRTLELTAGEARLPLVDGTGVARGEILVTSATAREDGERGGDDSPGPLRLDHLDALVVVRQ